MIENKFTIEDFRRSFENMGPSQPIIFLVTPKMRKLLSELVHEYVKEYVKEYENK